MSGETATNTQLVQNGDADISWHISPFVQRKTEESSAKRFRRHKKVKESNVKEAEAIVEVFFSDKLDRPPCSESASDLLPEIESADLECDDTSIFDSSELDFYYEKKGKICRRKGERLKSEELRRFCRASTQPSEAERKKRTAKSKAAPFDLCKKEIVRSINKRENVSYSKENVEKDLKKKNIQRKWPDGMPRVERTAKQDEKVVEKNPRRKPKRVTTVTSQTGPLHVYNNSDFILKPDNADKFGEDQLLSFLIQLQDRDITPEDFDALLHLDDFVEPKTLPKTLIDALKTDTVASGTDDVCTICMDEYGIGDVRKYLPCGHRFHSSCVRTWLSTVSFKCPIDGWEIH